MEYGPFDLGTAEGCRSRSDADVAGECQFEAASQTIAVHRGNHGLSNSYPLPEPVLTLIVPELAHAAAEACAVQTLEVRSYAECPVARSRQNGNAQILVAIEVLEAAAVPTVYAIRT